MDDIELNAKKARLKEIEAQQRTLREEASKLTMEIAEAEATFKVGEHVEWKFGSGTRHGLVEHINPGYFGNHGYIVRIIRKDGSKGSTTRIGKYEQPRRYEEAQ